MRARPPLVREFLLVAGLFLAYKFGRQAANGHTEEAFRNAGNVWDLERALHLPVRLPRPGAWRSGEGIPAPAYASGAAGPGAFAAAGPSSSVGPADGSAGPAPGVDAGPQARTRAGAVR
ncbi:hypothetical protein EES46_17755 [Streptomyces sp. ADI98-10]|nr:hypothetical protein EES46_17755 [Streptomyces sp. ADI98-10]